MHLHYANPVRRRTSTLLCRWSRARAFRSWSGYTDTPLPGHPLTWIPQTSERESGPSPAWRRPNTRADSAACQKRPVARVEKALRVGDNEPFGVTNVGRVEPLARERHGAQDSHRKRKNR